MPSSEPLDLSDNIPLLPRELHTLCKIFEKSALEHPNSIAVREGNSILSYRELDIKSTWVAKYLIAQGIVSGDIVALSMPHGQNLIVGAIGIMKAGGVYCPIDPHYPVLRFNQIIQDARPTLLLTQEDVKDNLPNCFCNTLMIEQCLTCQAETNELPKIEPTQLAYITYTSGSTGHPKGIMIQHDSVVQSIQIRTNYYPRHPISLLRGSISFDASILIIFYTLMTAGTICIQPDDVLNGSSLIDFINENSINFILCVPQVYELLLKHSPVLDTLECVSLAGDVMPGKVPYSHAQSSPNAVLFNDYGPSENAIGATIAKIYDPKSKQLSKITIGKPLPHVQIYLLDEQLKSVPIGEKGEIYIGGPGLARGYLNKTELTNEKFFPIALSGQKPQRLYRTGDYARLLPDGNLDFLGRVDSQVKIHGYRVELGEIEHAASEYPDTSATIAIAEKDEWGHTKLALFFSSNTQKSISDPLRAYLKNKFPQHMVPTFLLQIDSWPQTPNGKIDRKALSAQLQKHMTAIHKPVLRQNSDLESSLLNIWRKLLGHPKITINDNFFKIGGDSLLLANMQALIEKHLGLDISTTDLFENPTIFKLVRHLSNSSESKAESSLQAAGTKRKEAFQKFKKKMVPTRRVSDGA